MQKVGRTGVRAGLYVLSLSSVRFSGRFTL